MESRIPPPPEGKTQSCRRGGYSTPSAPGDKPGGYSTPVQPGYAGGSPRCFPGSPQSPGSRRGTSWKVGRTETGSQSVKTSPRRNSPRASSPRITSPRASVRRPEQEAKPSVDGTRRSHRGQHCISQAEEKLSNVAVRQNDAQRNAAKALAWAEEHKARLDAAAARKEDVVTVTRSASSAGGDNKTRPCRTQSPKPCKEVSGSALRDALICRCPYAVNRLGLSGQNGGAPNQWELYAESLGFAPAGFNLEGGMSQSLMQRDSGCLRPQQRSPQRSTFIFEASLRDSSH